MDKTKTIYYWDKLVEPYKKPSLFKSFFQLISTLLFLISICYFMYVTKDNYYFITLLLSIFGGLFIVKIFIIQHDCGHGSFFKSKRANNILGPLLTVFTMTPYGQWAKEHNRHHATSGNLNHRGVGDVTTFTVSEYIKSSKFKRILYRIYRNPLFLFTVGAVTHFLIKQRFPFYKTKRFSSWISVIFTNIYMLAAISFFCYFIGTKEFIKIYIPLSFVAAVVGTWIFYVQHQYENTYWEDNKNWNYCDAALNGSSFYDLPKWLHWITGYISYHHIHHLSSKIPNYNLEKCYYGVKELRNPVKLGIWESRKCLHLSLWDEAKKRMVSFDEVKRA